MSHSGDKVFLDTRDFFPGNDRSHDALSAYVGVGPQGYIYGFVHLSHGQRTLAFDFSGGEPAEQGESLRRLNFLLTKLHETRDALVAAQPLSAKRREQAETRGNEENATDSGLVATASPNRTVTVRLRKAA